MTLLLTSNGLPFILSIFQDSNKKYKYKAEYEVPEEGFLAFYIQVSYFLHEYLNHM